MSLTEFYETQTMCLSFCYAGRNGHCRAAGTGNDQVMNCLSQYRREQKAEAV